MVFEWLVNLVVTKYIIRQCLGKSTKGKTFSVLFLSSVKERILILMILMREAKEIFPFLTALILHVLVRALLILQARQYRPVMTNQISFFLINIAVITLNVLFDLCYIV